MGDLLQELSDKNIADLGDYDLTCLDLSGLDFAKFNVDNCDFRGSNLQGTKGIDGVNLKERGNPSEFLSNDKIKSCFQGLYDYIPEKENRQGYRFKLFRNISGDVPVETINIINSIGGDLVAACDENKSVEDVLKVIESVQDRISEYLQPYSGPHITRRAAFSFQGHLGKCFDALNEHKADLEPQATVSQEVQLPPNGL